MKECVLNFRNIDFYYEEDSSKKSHVIDFIADKFSKNRKKIKRKQFVLQSLDFSVSAGEIVGILGGNGAGKSTVLKLASGILFPTKGEIHYSKVIAPIIELGTGFSPDFSARENILLYGCLLGNRRQIVRNAIPSIASWAGIEDVLDQSMRTFSTGMVSKTAFSTATHFPANLVLIDEVLSVGDVNFRKKSELRMKQILNSGAGVLFVSHDLDAVRNLTHRALVLHQGQIIFDGDPTLAVEKYLRATSE
jgi:ABC-type polysaccharide/polyol phosphate transport system ATPase subunit